MRKEKEAVFLIQIKRDKYNTLTTVIMTLLITPISNNDGTNQSAGILLKSKTRDLVTHSILIKLKLS